MEKFNIIIADNQYLTRRGLSDYISNWCVSATIIESYNKEDLLEKLSSLLPRLLIIDFDIFDFNSLDDLLSIHKTYPETTIIIFTNNFEPQQVEKIIEFGITNYVLKSSEKDELETAFNAALNNKRYFSEDILEVLVSKKTKQKTSQNNSHLTHSETEIIKLIAQGMTTKEIAAKKFISFHTVITHRKNIFKKLGINNTSELVMFAIKTGIIDTTEYYI